MIFRHISYRIALQFMGFVFLLFLVNGALFLAADFGNSQRQARFRLDNSARLFARQADQFPALPKRMPPFFRESIRIVDVDGNAFHTGSFFTDIPFSPTEDSEVTVQGGHYRVLTSPVVRDGKLLGYVQIADNERLRVRELPFRAFLYFMMSAVISILTFGVGLFFARRSLRPAEQMVERLEQFTQDASHELKTPLTAVSTSIDLALLEKDNREYLLTAKKDLKDVFTLIERLLELARLDKFVLETESVDLSALTEDTIAKHHSFAKEKNVKIESNLVGNIEVGGDPPLLRQVIGNLLSNAIKFNKSEGHVSVRLTKDSLQIEDSGRGISDDALPHIFDRFYQEEESRTQTTEGIGLGLALVKRIVDLHGWSIDVESKKGKGTTFTIGFESRY